MQYGTDGGQVTEEHVIAVVSDTTGIPAATLRGLSDRTDYAAAISASIVGQDAAVAEVASELSLIKAGRTDPTKPASVMLFAGQTGTGKTELAKTLARMYSSSKRPHSYSMANFIEPHSIPFHPMSAASSAFPPATWGTMRAGG